jgi:hypothetical protein
MSLLPKGDEVEDLLGFLAFAQVGVGIAEGVIFLILGQKDEDAGLSAAARRHVVGFNLWILAVVGHGVEIQVEGVSLQKGVLGCGGVPSPEEPLSQSGSDPTRILAEETLFRSDVEAGEEGQPLIGRQSHDMAFARQGP